jgi:hypothetical protein
MPRSPFHSHRLPLKRTENVATLLAAHGIYSDHGMAAIAIMNQEAIWHMVVTAEQGAHRAPKHPGGMLTEGIKILET